ncbi:M24 family metallopeptidase [Chlamydia vaughanii]|uniref:M24 family metallopeptidase n=1 Tax=Chlamydia vaughanii TaxID=3112552 RepID=UPI0032B30357
MFQDRIERAQAALKDYNVDAFIIERSEDIAYFLDDQANTGTLLIGRNEAVFFVYRMDKDIYANVKGASLVFCDKNIAEFLIPYLETTDYQTIGFDSLHTSFHKYQERENAPCSWIPMTLFSEKLRSRKSADEIEKMRQAATLGSEGYDHVLSILQEGISEKEVARLLRVFWAKAGAEGTSFSPIIAFGEHAAFPHAVPTDRVLRKGDIILIDIGVLYQGYCSDMSRTIAWGRPDSRLVESYPAVVEAQKSAIQLCQAGVPCLDIHEEAARILRKYDLEQYFCHGVGHGVGRNIHEHPVLSPKSGTTVLETGMTVTVEPGVYFPGVGGIRIEDTLLIEGNKNFSLTDRPVSAELVFL